MVILIQASQKLPFAPDTSQVSLSMDTGLVLANLHVYSHPRTTYSQQKSRKKQKKQLFSLKDVPIDVRDDIRVIRGLTGVPHSLSSRQHQKIRT